MVFVGVQPVLMQVPPRNLSSTSATLHPRSARRCASGLPPCPEPRMIASYFIARASSASERRVTPPVQLMREQLMRVELTSKSEAKRRQGDRIGPTEVGLYPCINEDDGSIREFVRQYPTKSRRRGAFRARAALTARFPGVLEGTRTRCAPAAFRVHDHIPLHFPSVDDGTRAAAGLSEDEVPAHGR